MSVVPPIVALTQGDPAGVGPEVLCKMLARPPAAGRWRPLVIAERAAIEAVVGSVRTAIGERLVFLARSFDKEVWEALPEQVIPVIDPIGVGRAVEPGKSTSADAASAMAAL